MNFSDPKVENSRRHLRSVEMEIFVNWFMFSYQIVTDLSMANPKMGPIDITISIEKSKHRE